MGDDAVRVTTEEYQQLDLRAHTLLGDVPLHDVWRLDLQAGGPERNVVDLLALLSMEKIVKADAAVKFLFGLRTRIGQLFGWDREPAQPAEDSFLARLSSEDRASSLVPPGTPDGPFTILLVSPRESIAEIINPTVHAFSVFVLLRSESGYRFYWAIYVRPVGGLTEWYMRVIDPFRRFIIYPAILRYLAAAWVRERPGTTV